MPVHDESNDGESQNHNGCGQKDYLPWPPVVRRSRRRLNGSRTIRLDNRAMVLNPGGLNPGMQLHSRARGPTICRRGFGHWSDEPVAAPGQSLDESWVTG